MSAVARWAALSLTTMLTACMSHPSAAPACRRDEAALMALDYEAFDQDLTPGGWREVAAVPDCARDAARLISHWREAHEGKLSPAEQWTLWWHEGQALASAGDYQAAVRRMQTAQTFHDDSPPPPGTPDDEVEMFRANILVRDAWEEATLAFLRRDRAAFEKSRAQMLAIPEPAGFAEVSTLMKERTGTSMSWPLNIEDVERMRACFNQPYDTDCRERKAQ
jgi:hypothetical protein